MPIARRVYPTLGVVALVIALSGVGHAQLPPPPPPPPPPPVFGQASDPALPVGTGAILGRVVDGATGRPMSGVLVRVSGPPGAAPGAPVAPLNPAGASAGQPTPALTNAQGQFLFRNLSSGRYGLTAQFGGYLPGSYGQTRADGPSGQVRLIDGQRLTDITIRMWKYGAITGRLLDEVGEPAVGLTVRVLRRSTVGRQSQWVPGPQSTTDDRGIYRLGSLTPGEYVVVTTAGIATVPISVSEMYSDAVRSGNTATLPLAVQEASASPVGGGTRVGDLQVQPLRNALPPPPTSLDDVLAYQTVYHPSATRLADATRVRVGPGEERTAIDLQARLVKTFRVSGRIVGVDGQPLSAGLTLLPGDARDLSSDFNFETGSAVSGDDGRFTFVGVPPGQYTIRMLRAPRPPSPSPGMMTTISMSGGGGITTFSTVGGVEAGPPAAPPDEPTLWAETAVSVAADHVENVSIAVRPGARLRGRVEFEGPGTAVEPRQRQQIMFSLVSASGRVGGPRQPFPGRLTDGDAFATSQYPPGRYFVNVSAPGLTGWHARSVMVAGRNALEHPFDLGPSDLDGAVVTFTSRTTELAGTVRGASGPSPHATVAVFPADHDQWIANGMRSTRARTVATGQDGSFHLTGLLPGAYRAVAVPAGAPLDLQDPETIEALAPMGTSVTLAEGETRSVSLTVSSPR